MIARAALALHALVVPLWLSACCCCELGLDNFVKFECRSKQSEAKSNLKALHTLQLAHKQEHGRYGSLDEIGFEPYGEELRYSYVIVELEDERYGAEARGLVDGMEGDVWAIDQRGTPQVVASVCGPVPEEQPLPSSAIEVRAPKPERLLELRRTVLVRMPF